jgi:translation elongation factor EF-Tu-like GTPase
MAERLVGSVTHFWGEPGVAGIDLTGDLAVGDTIHVVGHTTDFTLTVDSIQIDHQSVESAGAGDPIGIKVPERARTHDEVFVVTD